MKKKLGILVVVLALGGAGWFGWTHLRFFLYTMHAREVIDDGLGRFPSADQIIALRTQLKDKAASRGVPVQDFGVGLVLKQVDAGPIKFWFLDVEVHEGTKTFFYRKSNRIESIETVLGEEEKLKEAGVVIERPAAPPASSGG